MLSDLQLVNMGPRNSTQLLKINTTKFQVEREPVYKSDILLMKKKIWITTSNIYSLGNNYVYSMSTNQLFSLNFTISNQSTSGIKSEIRPLSCQRTNYRNSRDRGDRIDLNRVASKDLT